MANPDPAMVERRSSVSSTANLACRWRRRQLSTLDSLSNLGIEALVKDSQIQLILVKVELYLGIEALVKDSQIQLMPNDGILGAR